MSIELSVIVPCYNEVDNVRALSLAIQEVFKRLEIEGELIFVDDASQDDTLEVLKELSEEFDFVNYAAHKTNKGMSVAWQTGAENAEGRLISIIDADFQYLPEDITRLYREYQLNNVDIVQGYRSEIGRKKDLRYIQSIGLNFILNTLFNMKLSDNKSGFLICKKQVFLDILRRRFKYQFFQTFIMVSAHHKGYTIKEIEVLFQNRRAGQSFLADVPFIAVFKILYEILIAFREFRLSSRTRTNIADTLDKKKINYKKCPFQGWRKALWLVQYITWPLHTWSISRNAVKYFYEFNHSQHLSKEEIEEIQAKKLRAIVHHSYKHVGYYRELFDQNNLKPEDIKSLEDLNKIPELTKDDIRKNVHFNLLSDNHDKRRVHKISTSGSTGEPLIIYVDRFQLEMRWAATLRSMLWTGWNFGDKQARLWHQTIGMNKIQVAKEYLNALINRRIFIPAYELSNENLNKWISKIEEHQPVLIDGYAESFNFLSYFIKNKGEIKIKPKAIMSSAQELPKSSRETIEEAFGCKVYDKYGSREFSGIAYEAETPGEHLVVSENYIVEIVKNGEAAEPGAIGEVLVTDLNNKCMPLIRYRIGDLARTPKTKKREAARPGLMRIGSIEGRTQAIIVGGNGKYLPGTFFAHFFKDFEHIIQHYQIIQEEIGKIKLLIVKGPHFTDNLFSEILDQLLEHIGETTEVDQQFVDKIPLGRTGKRQGAISKMKFDEIRKNMNLS